MDVETVAPGEKNRIIEGVGEVEFVRSRNARSISIQVRPFAPVKVVIPHYSSLADAERFLRTKLDWLRKTVAKKNKAERGFTVFDNTTEFSTVEHKLVLLPEERKNINILVKNGIIQIKYPAQVNAKHPLVQQCIRKGIEEAWRIEAGKYLPERTHELAKQFGYKIKSVSVRNSKTRWGSCSVKNDIALSIHCIRLPQRLIDYVILHELVHTIHKDHSDNYHRELERILPGEKELSKEIGKLHIKIY